MKNWFCLILMLLLTTCASAPVFASVGSVSVETVALPVGILKPIEAPKPRPNPPRDPPKRPVLVWI